MRLRAALAAGAAAGGLAGMVAVATGAAAGALAVTIVAVAASQPAVPGASRISDTPSFGRASAFIERDYDRFVRELVTLTEIPAPPFKEERRARAFLELLGKSGLSSVEMDGAGNVMGVRRGRGDAPVLAVVAHLDTVFPEGTDVTVKREGIRLLAPGIGDNTRGLALMLAIIRAMDAGGFETPGDILFVGNVGEEGEGDLRGVKHLLREGKYKDRIGAFIAIDGGDQGTITRGGVGSRRYRVVFSGPGGHSYGAFGLVNPAYAMAGAVAALARITVPHAPKTTYNVGVVSGGTSVNSIPSEVSMDVDLRSESCAELQKLSDQLSAILTRAADDENRHRSTREGRIAVRPALIGDRPCGETPLESPLVRTAAAVVRGFGMTPSYATSSTDSNLPMSMGIPAITIGRGGGGGRAHSPDEWVDVEPAGAKRAAEVALAIVLEAAAALQPYR